MRQVDLKMTTTALVTTIIIIALAIYDLIVVVVGKGTEQSVSQFMVSMGWNAPMVVFGVGFICGHLFGYMRPTWQVRKDRE